MGGCYVRTVGREGRATLLIRAPQAGEAKIDFTVEIK